MLLVPYFNLLGVKLVHIIFFGQKVNSLRRDCLCLTYSTGSDPLIPYPLDHLALGVDLLIPIAVGFLYLCHNSSLLKCVKIAISQRIKSVKIASLAEITSAKIAYCLKSPNLIYLSQLT